MMTLTHRLQPHLDVVDTELEGDETVLLHLESKLYYSLNRTGTRIWNGIKQQLSLQTISDHLQEEFGVEADQADASVLALADDLWRQHLVVAADGDTGVDEAE
ncbi:MAG TPA: PqqD family protein [Vicinamibacterales bacterium]|nr:PqqD family protein [Vicinamibacterales bacterium]